MKFARVLIACVLALGIYLSAPNRIVQSNASLASDPVGRLMAQTGGKAVIGRDHATGLVEFIGTDLNAPIQASGFLPQTAAPEQAGMEFARGHNIKLSKIISEQFFLKKGRPAAASACRAATAPGEVVP